MDQEFSQKINLKNIILYSSNVLISESENNPDVYICKFILCDFDINKNGVGLNRDTINEWMSTLKNKPVVGKISVRYDGKEDFTNHAVEIVEKIDENGNTYQDIVFNSDAFGTFTDVFIENIDGIDYLVATAEIWKRFERACNIILNRVESGELKTSWEISVVDAVKKFTNGKIAKIINYGRFLGHAMLGNGTEPAYDSSKLLNIAQEDSQDFELSNALTQDIIFSNINVNKIQEQEVQNLTEDIEKLEENIESNEEKKDISALTDWDLREKIRDACREKIKDWCYIAFHFPVDRIVWVEANERDSELDYKLFTYEVIDDTVTVSEPKDVKLMVSVHEINSKLEESQLEIESKNSTIIDLNRQIKSLTEEISEISIFKEKFEESEQIRIANELKEKQAEFLLEIKELDIFSEEELDNDEISTLISELNRAEINSLIVKKIQEINSIKKKPDAPTKKDKETLTSEVRVDLSTTDDISYDYRKFINAYIGKI